ncbi:hypothetical protein Nepgr_000677 [Nepenthes gracilis]|uniref:Uncharacterized protein n=1 Tax=Nepenthes gracilis TaxID=150966 RepID=A0AAD3P5P9_NEPGR|nr:hypothetical protein Nepgr_000677 [Nepenthes gracilis]
MPGRRGLGSVRRFAIVGGFFPCPAALLFPCLPPSFPKKQYHWKVLLQETWKIFSNLVSIARISSLASGENKRDYLILLCCFDSHHILILVLKE